MKKISLLLLCSTFLLSAFASSEIKSNIPILNEPLFKKEKSLKIDFLKVKSSILSDVSKTDDTYCTVGHTTVYFMYFWPQDVTCVRCSSVSMSDAQTQVADCLMDAQMYPY